MMRTGTRLVRRGVAALAVALAALVAFPQQAEAGVRLYVGHRSVFTSGYPPCGCAIRQVRIVRGFDRYHRPLYRYAPYATRHTCRPRHHRGYYGHAYPHGRVTLDHRNYRHERRYQRERRRDYHRNYRLNERYRLNQGGG